MDPDLDCCDVCGGPHETQFCPELELADLATPAISLTKARLTLPQTFDVLEKPDGTLGVFAKVDIPAKSKFGPFEARRTTHEFYTENCFLLKVFSKDGAAVSLDTTDENECNWMCLVQTALATEQQNCMAIQIGTEIYYCTTKEITTGEEVTVWYAPHYAKKLGKCMQPDGSTQVMLGLTLPSANAAVMTEVYEELQQSGNASVEPDADHTQLSDHTPDQSVAESSLCEEPEDNKSDSDANNGNDQSDFQASSTLQHRCDICSVDFSSKFLLDQHMYMHNRENAPDEDASELLSVSLQQATGMVPKQMRIVHPIDQDGPVQCSRCHRTFEDNQSLAIHIKCEHLFVFGKGRGKRGRPPKNLSKETVGRKVGKPLPVKSCSVMLGGMADTKKEVVKDMDGSSETDHQGISQDDDQPVLSESADINLLLKSVVNDVTEDQSDVQQRDDELEANSASENGMVTAEVSYLDTDMIMLNSQENAVPTQAEVMNPETVAAVLMSAAENVPEEESQSYQMAEDNLVTPVPEATKDFNENNSDSSVKEGVNVDAVAEALKLSETILEDNMGEEYKAIENSNPLSLESLNEISGNGNETRVVETSQTNSCNDNHTADVEETLPTDKDSSVEESIAHKQHEPESSVMEESETQVSGESSEMSTDKTPTVCVRNDEAEEPDFPAAETRTIAESAEPGDGDTSVVELDEQAPPVKRKRGRPRKNPLPVQNKKVTTHTEEIKQETTEHRIPTTDFSPTKPFEKEKRKAGRPRRYEQDEEKLVVSPQPLVTVAQTAPTVGKRKRGRPRKYVPTEEEDKKSDDDDLEDENTNATPMTSKKSDKIAFSFATSPTKIMNSPTPIRPQRERRSTFSKSEWVIPKFCRIKVEKTDSDTEENKAKETKKEHKAKPVVKPKTPSGNKMVKENDTELIEDSNDDQVADEINGEVEKPGEDIEEPKRRGRKRKLKRDSYEDDGDWKPPQSVVASSSPVKRGRGRPRKSLPIPQVGKREMGESLKRASTLKETKENCDTFIDDDNRLMYGCKECGKQFYKIKYLDRHMAAHRGTFTCSVCKKSFARKETLVNHTCAVKEEGETSTDSGHTCGKCGKMFKSQANLDKHMEVHSTRYKCDVCRQTFISEDLRDAHDCKGPPTEEATSGEKKFSCDFCGQAFTKQKYLYRHMAAHTGEFPCNGCNRWFSRKEALLGHMRKCNPEGIVQEEGTYPCEMCTKVFSKRSTLEKHMNLHKESYKCSDCKKSFTSEVGLETHKCVPVIEKDGLFVCEVCGKGFAKQLYLQRHMAVHGDGVFCNFCSHRFARKDELLKHVVVCASNLKIMNEGSVNCHVCGETFTKADEFSYHVKSHTHPFKCNDCGRMFMRKINMEGHKCEPISNTPTECVLCKKEFRSEKHLKRHMRIHEAAQFQCDVCQKKFHSQDFLNNHTCRKPDGTLVRKKMPVDKKYKYEPSEEAPHMCHICGRSYISVSNLNKHMFSHGKKEVECPLCGKLFYHRSSMNLHLKGVHTNNLDFQCNECGRQYKSRNSLVMHVKNFHGSTITVYECPTCGRQFRQKGNLKKHLLTHSDKKTFVCNHCQQTFKYPEQLRRHTLEHLHGPRHACDYCDRKFVMPHELRKHVKIFHQGVVYGCDVCGVECRHYHTMKRHLRRRHPEVDANTDYVRGLMRQTKNITYVRPKTYTKPATPATYTEPVNKTETSVTYTVPVPKPAEAQNIVLAEPIITDAGEEATHTFIIEKQEGIDADEQQTVVIQTTGQFDNEAIVSQQVAEALQSLRESAGIEGLDGETTISIGDISQLVPGQPFPVTLTGMGNAETQGFILVPTMVEEQEQAQTQTVQEITLN